VNKVTETANPSSPIFFNSTNTGMATMTSSQASVPLTTTSINSVNPSISHAPFVPTTVPGNKATETYAQSTNQASEPENRAPESGINNQVPIKPRKRSRKDEVDVSFVLPEGATRAHKPRQMADDTCWDGTALKRSRHK
jgi:hypothetical protein